MRFGDYTTIQKRRKREAAADARMGPKKVWSTVLTPEEEAAVVTFRRHTLPKAVQQGRRRRGRR